MLDCIEVYGLVAEREIEIKILVIKHFIIFPIKTSTKIILVYKSDMNR